MSDRRDYTNGLPFWKHIAKRRITTFSAFLGFTVIGWVIWMITRDVAVFWTSIGATVIALVIFPVVSYLEFRDMKRGKKW